VQRTIKIFLLKLYFGKWLRELKIENEHLQIICGKFIFLKRKYNDLEISKIYNSDYKRLTFNDFNSVNKNVDLIKEEIKSKRNKIRKTVLLNNASSLEHNNKKNSLQINQKLKNLEIQKIKFLEQEDSEENVLAASFSILSK
jgi:hypothetical protein